MIGYDRFPGRSSSYAVMAFPFSGSVPMTYRATQDVVRRVMPLIERLATRSIDKARLLQYLSARAGVDWGVHDLVADVPTIEAPDDSEQASRLLTFRDRVNGAEHTLRFPVCLIALPDEIEPLLVEEYKRLAVDRPLTVMAQPLFDYFYRAEFCARCRWRGVEHAQIRRECLFAGRPINFEDARPVG